MSTQSTVGRRAFVEIPLIIIIIENPIVEKGKLIELIDYSTQIWNHPFPEN